ncbi:MAG: hypothetical protein H0T89_36705 [Deltaproteobacteria bacterium]|nr:hypothetical protein [Deltaproteobacteria bacterium]MBA3819106.1 hypothetical protein [Deltaproteobacteria bacterium]
MKSLAFAILTVVAVIFATVVTSRSDATVSPPTYPVGPEPITGKAAVPRPGSETPQRDPFSPYDPGPPEALWGSEQLGAAEKAVLDHGRDVSGWSSVHDGFRNAVLEQQPAFAAGAATSQLGIDDLATLGVLP